MTLSKKEEAGGRREEGREKERREKGLYESQDIIIRHLFGDKGILSKAVERDSYNSS